MVLRHERISIAHMPVKLRILHLSDIHFSAVTTHEDNLRVIEEIMALAAQCEPVNMICITGDLVSRKFTQESLDDAVLLCRRLREFLKYGDILFSMGNHEMDLPENVRKSLKQRLLHEGAVSLDNQRHEAFHTGYGETDNGVCVVGLTLPQTVYKNSNGSYLGLETITKNMIDGCLGQLSWHHPCILLAHTPLGVSAYAEWGADVVLSGHIHGGIVRLGNTGFLSPERRFLPHFTKGIYREGGCVMNVSAGIGKFRVNNPAEVVCIEIG